MSLAQVSCVCVRRFVNEDVWRHGATGPDLAGADPAPSEFNNRKQTRTNLNAFLRVLLCHLPMFSNV